MEIEIDFPKQCWRYCINTTSKNDIIRAHAVAGVQKLMYVTILGYELLLS